jgi:hypothetical protein
MISRVLASLNEIPATRALLPHAHPFLGFRIDIEKNSTMDKATTHEARMQLAMANLNSQLDPNYTATAKRFDLVRSTLTRRIHGQSRSRAEYLSSETQRLTRQQEEVLIGHINRLTDRSMPPTAHIVTNMAEEIAGARIGKNWTSEFVKRHKKSLKSSFLRSIDNLRVKADNTASFQSFYDQVSSKIG